MASQARGAQANHRLIRQNCMAYIPLGTLSNIRLGFGEKLNTTFMSLRVTVDKLHLSVGNISNKVPLLLGETSLSRDLF